MAERRPDLAREHRLHDRFRGPPRASPVRFQVSRPADRASRGWARGVPLAECRFPGPATRRLGRLRRESERSTAPGICAPLRENLWWCVVVVVVAAPPNYLRQASQNLGKYFPSNSGPGRVNLRICFKCATRCSRRLPAHAAGVVPNVTRMSERVCRQQGWLPSAYDLELPEGLRHHARRHLPGSACSCRRTIKPRKPHVSGPSRAQA